jgi:polar amino acid transport system substrate-binding protein
VTGVTDYCSAMKKSSLHILAGGAALTLSLGLTACGSDDGGSADTDSNGDGTSIQTINEGALTVCSDIPYPPFEFQQEGEYTGFDMDLMKEISAGLDLEMEVQDSAFEGLQSGLSLNSNQCDIVASAMTINEEREAKLDFTDPYYDSKQSLLVPADSDIASIDDLSGKKVGVQQGTTGKTFAEENAPDDAEIVSFPSDGEMFPAIQAGQVDALLQDLPVNIEHAKEGEFELVEEFETDEQYGFAVRKGNTELRDAVNQELETLRDDGTYEEIYNKYFSAE